MQLYVTYYIITVDATLWSVCNPLAFVSWINKALSYLYISIVTWQHQQFFTLTWHEEFFTLDRSGLTRGHSWKLKPITPRLDIKLYFFSYRVVNVWNSLSPSTVEAASFNALGHY